MGGDSRKNSTLLGKCFSKYKIQKLWKESASQNTEYKNSGEEVYLKIQNMPPCSLCSPIDHNPNMCSSEQRKLEMTLGGFPPNCYLVSAGHTFGKCLSSSSVKSPAPPLLFGVEFQLVIGVHCMYRMFICCKTLLRAQICTLIGCYMRQHLTY